MWEHKLECEAAGCLLIVESMTCWLLLAMASVKTKVTGSTLEFEVGEMFMK